MLTTERLGRRLWLINLGLWILFYAPVELTLTASGAVTGLVLVCILAGVLLGFGQSFVVQWAVTASEPLRLPKRLAAVAGVILACALISGVFDVVSLGLALNPGMTLPRISLNTFSSFSFLLWVYAFYGACVWLIRTSVSLVEKERRLAWAEAETQKAVLASLRFQVNPHFLFNALNATAALIAGGRSREAEEVVLRLSEFFRASLAMDPERVTSLAEEFEILESYLQIEKIRFSDRMTVEVDFPPDLENARVPGLLLQPLAENAVKHAVAPALRPIHVQVLAAREADALVLSVSDDGDQSVQGQPGQGVGLRNVTERLAALYGPKARVEAGVTGEGYRVSLRFPLEFTPAALGGAA